MIDDTPRNLNYKTEEAYFLWLFNLINTCSNSSANSLYKFHINDNNQVIIESFDNDLASFEKLGFIEIIDQSLLLTFNGVTFRGIDAMKKIEKVLAFSNIQPQSQFSATEESNHKDKRSGCSII
ncbi:hypothetical protein DGG96_18835 [Legionella qingyii]|uniref:Uncharacterized protein n=1 Tax=Legionella qingyii TaxID=2184757 RepID=A0A317U055_9GAMM|nr:hypothetical protein [Legionella qingyii]PWY54096.1 hypothetical protein DGG96_18835 [Legionella qingyii]RUR19352.1 hypothetical protein ELY20_15945 [Legionella qingyii]RUR21718.1 hypothetical protein ELY16_15910 [Legionella qingyii]